MLDGSYDYKADELLFKAIFAQRAKSMRVYGPLSKKEWSEMPEFEEYMNYLKKKYDIKNLNDVSLKQ